MPAEPVPEHVSAEVNSAMTDAVLAARSGQVVYLRDHGQDVAAVIPLEVVHVAEAALAALEDAHDVAAAQAARDEIAAGEPVHQWSDVKAELGL